MENKLTTLRTGIHSVRLELEVALALARKRKTKMENIKNPVVDRGKT